MTLPQDHLLTPQEAADFLRISRSRLYQLAHSGSLHGLRVGYQWRFLPSDLEEYLGRASQPPEEAAP